jgi:hypothetical protein
MIAPTTELLLDTGDEQFLERSTVETGSATEQRRSLRG